MIAPFDCDPREVFHQNDRGPVVLHPAKRRERDGEPAERSVGVGFREGEPAPHRGEVRDGLVVAVLEAEGDALVECRAGRREVAAGLRHAAMPVQRVRDPVPRLHGSRELERLRQDTGCGLELTGEEPGLPEPHERAHQIH